jgi:hypothetical protein
MAGTMGMPEVFYGQNKFFLACPAKNFLLDICNIKSVAGSAFKAR